MQGRKTTPSSFILLERQAQGMPQGKLCALHSPSLAASAINCFFVACGGVVCMSVYLTTVVRHQYGLRVKDDEIGEV